MVAVRSFNFLEAEPHNLYLINASTAFLMATPDVYLIADASLYDPEENPSGIFLCTDGFVRLTDKGFSKIYINDPAIPAYNHTEADKLFQLMETLKPRVIFISDDLAPLGKSYVYATTAHTLTELNHAESVFIQATKRTDYFSTIGDIFILTDGTLTVQGDDEFIPLIPDYDQATVSDFQSQYRT